MRLLKLPRPLGKKPWTPNLSEIHQYTDDLKQVTFLRDKCQNKQERERYDDCIEVMQEVLVRLNTEPKKASRW